MTAEATSGEPIRVWAPRAGRVEIDLIDADGHALRAPMAAEPDGWWSWSRIAPSDPAAGSLDLRFPIDYGFRIDDGPVRPDPRSAWQPAGVHGRSRTYDPAQFPWTDAAWAGVRDGAADGALGAVFYELHVGTFTADGTLDAAIERLPHLVALGVDVVELLPVAQFEGRWGWGYDGVDLYAVHHDLGGPAALARFVDAAHAAGLGVCLDVVYNHLGPSGNYLAEFGPYFTDGHLTPWGPAINLDGGSCAAVREFVIDNALRWFRDFHVDALRLDAVHELRDDSDRHLLAELADRRDLLAAQLGRPLTLVAESDLNDPAMVTPTGRGGFGMDAQWADDVHHALHAVLTGESSGYYADFAEPGVLAKVLAEVFLHDGRYSSFRGRDWGRPVDRAAHSGSRFLGYLQTHDQIGNRATGDRISASITAGQQAGAAALYLLGGFTPMIFMGEEWAADTPWQFFSSFGSDQLAEAVRAGRRAEFATHGWAPEQIPDPQDPATRDRSVLDWAEIDPAGPPSVGDLPAPVAGHRRMLRWYTDLIALRHSDPRMSDGRLDALTVTTAGDGSWLVLGREAVRVAVNLSPEPVSLPDPDGPDGPVGQGILEGFEPVLAWEPQHTTLRGGILDLPGHGVAVLVRPGEIHWRGPRTLA